MARWTFRTYASSSGRDEIAAWYEALPLGDRAKVFRRLQQLRDTPGKQWTNYKTLASFRGMGRVRVDRYRLIGFFGPWPTEFTFVHAFIKKSDKDYGRCESMCKRRMDEVKSDKGYSNEWRLEP